MPVNERFVCAEASEDRAEGVVATASQVHAWLLIEVRGAWGAQAIEESRLGAWVPEGWRGSLRRRGIRPICIRPSLRVDDDDDEVQLFFVVAARPGRSTGTIWSRTVPSLADVSLAGNDLPLDAPPRGWTRHEQRLVLVCTNGKHDQCCANRGRPVVRHLRGSRWADQVWECSHIGGDRFAANLVVLPDSLYFGRMEPEEAEAILDAHAAGAISLPWYRGRSTLRFVEQAAEHAMRAAYGVQGIDDVEFVAAPPGRLRARVAGTGVVEAQIEKTVVRTDVPLTCRGTPDQQVAHFEVTALDVVEPFEP